MDALVEWLTAESLYLPHWAWIAIALVAVIVVIVIIVLSAKGKKGKEEVSEPVQSEVAATAGPVKEEKAEEVAEPAKEENAEEQPAEPVAEEKADESSEPVKEEQAEEKADPLKDAKKIIIVKDKQPEHKEGTVKTTETKAAKPAEKKETKPVAATAKKSDTTAVKPAAKTATAKPAEKKEVKPAAAPAAEKKPASKTYHISLRKSDGMWQVKAAGAEKAIKLFKTQQEAIDYCKPLAENQDANIVIHKKDGSFRKLTY